MLERPLTISRRYSFIILKPCLVLQMSRLLLETCLELMSCMNELAGSLLHVAETKNEGEKDKQNVLEKTFV